MHVVKIALKKTKQYIFLLILFSMIHSYLTWKVAKNLENAIDNLFSDCWQSNFASIVRIIIFLNLSIMIIGYARDRITTKFKLKININLKQALYQHILKLEYKSYHNYDKTEMIQRMQEDSDVYANFFNQQFNLILDILFLSIFVLTESIQLNFMITCYLVLTIIVMLGFSIWYLKKLNQNIEELIKKRKKLLKVTRLNINHFKLIRIFNKQKEEIENYKKLNDDYTKTDIKLIKLILFYEIINDHITYLKNPILYMIGGIAIIKRKNDNRSINGIYHFSRKNFGLFFKFRYKLRNHRRFLCSHKENGKTVRAKRRRKRKGHL